MITGSFLDVLRLWYKRSKTHHGKIIHFASVVVDEFSMNACYISVQFYFKWT